jgi:hypothetical protein
VGFPAADGGAGVAWLEPDPDRLRVLRVRVRLTHLPAVQRARAVRAIRVPGDRIRVTWRTAASGADTAFLVTASATRAGAPRAVGAVFGRRGRRFALRLRHVRGLRFVSVSTLGSSVDPISHALVVRVR